MFDLKKALADKKIFYSRQSLSFYMVFNMGLGVDDVRELPTLINMHLHQTIDINDLHDGLTSGACVGRYRDENESDESSFECEGYFTDLTSLDIEHYNDINTTFRPPAFSRINKALMLASVAHKNQRRKYDNSPYFHHLLEVQNLLVNTADIKDEDIIISGLLHDVIEDSRTKQDTHVLN